MVTNIMVFLKRFYAEGFKSFAKPVHLNFQETMIGIVGPNGSGKSNIVDALKWAMGEQSIKSLRGKEKTNLIFAGSKDMDEADFAFVELTFDNSNRILHYDSDEVKISRKLIRKSGESVFMINDEPARLKDIQEIFLDSGLTKGSLGIISQGTVNWFAEAKPEERRHMFEEAAGIGRYTKQKEETLTLLDKASINLDRLDQYESSLKREIRDLSKQAEKAVAFKEKYNELQRLDVTLSVQEILAYKDETIALESQIAENEEKLNNIQISLDENKELRDKANLEYMQRDRQLTDINMQKDVLSKQISDLNFKKIAYVNNLENNLSSQNIEERKKSYELLIATDEAELSSYTKQLNDAQNNLNQLENEYQNLSQSKAEINQQYNEIIVDFNNKKTKHSQLVQQLQNSNTSDRGITTLLNAKEIISGIHNTVSSVISVNERYEVAIQTALGKSSNNLIVDTSETAVNAINFLKKNNGGRATLLPLDRIKPKEIRQDSLLIMSKLQGFIDTAANLVTYDAMYDNVIKSLLGNVAVADTIESANHISKMVNNNYKVISLEGDVVYAGGAMSGGQQQKVQSIFNLEVKIEVAKKELDVVTKKFTEIKIQQQDIDSQLSKKGIEIQSVKSSLSGFNTRISDLNARLTRNKAGYESIQKSSGEPERLKVEIADFEKQLIELNEQYAALEQKSVSAQDLKEHSHDLFSKYSMNYDRSQREFMELNQKFNQQQQRFITINSELKNIYNRISINYEMTVESAMQKYAEPLEISTNEAKQRISKLRNEIDGLGNINFEAVDRLADKEKELSSIEQEHNEAKESVANLRQIIDDLDKRARQDFNRVVNHVNQTIPGIFKNLFGGGNCEIKYTNPQNILESGIDVIVQPLGKKISNLVLLSGGEKTLVALTVLFALLKSSSFPLVVLDEAEAALDQANVSTFAKLIQEFSDNTQFLVITHRTGTMKMCDVLYGTTMQVKGVTKVIKTNLDDIKQMTSKENS